MHVMARGNPTSQISVLFNICLNIILSITIVLANKWIYTHHGFPAMTLTCLHFIFTTFGLIVTNRMGLFQVKALPIWNMLPLSFTFCGFVLFTNLSLRNNTVGTYQMAKVMTTPAIIIIQTRFYNKSFSSKVKATLFPIILGVYLNTYYDIKFDLVGVVYATISVLVTSMNQVWVNEKQHEFQVNPMQLLYYQAPLAATVLMFVIPFVEPVFGEQGIFSAWSLEAILLVIFTGIVAFLINLTIFWILGKTSPLTYNMMGHLKFCFTLVGSFFLFNDTLNYLQMVGIVLAFSGVLTYTYLKMQENNKYNSLTNIGEPVSNVK